MVGSIRVAEQIGTSYTRYAHLTMPTLKPNVLRVQFYKDVRFEKTRLYLSQTTNAQQKRTIIY
jgi:hypothetical protein